MKRQMPLFLSMASRLVVCADRVEGDTPVELIVINTEGRAVDSTLSGADAFGVFDEKLIAVGSNTDVRLLEERQAAAVYVAERRVFLKETR